MCICRLTPAWISSEISTKLLGMPTHLDRFSLTALDSLSCRLVTSAVRCRLATRVTLRQLPSSSSFFQLPLAFPPYFWSRRDRGLKPLFGFAPKQTKESSAWRIMYIVLQYVYFFLTTIFLLYMQPNFKYRWPDITQNLRHFPFLFSSHIVFCFLSWRIFYLHCLRVLVE